MRKGLQIKGNRVTSGYSGPEKYIIVTPLLLRFGPSRPCWAQNLLESKFDCTGFFRPGNSMLLSPPLLMLSQHYKTKAADVVMIR